MNNGHAIARAIAAYALELPAARLDAAADLLRSTDPAERREGVVLALAGVARAVDAAAGRARAGDPLDVTATVDAAASVLAILTAALANARG